MKQQPKKLYLSNKDRKIAGFCGGLAEYFNIDPTLMRLIYIVLTFISMGTGILVYLIAWIIVPRNPKN
ncbi:MAG: PspC domain-containing protein [Candidatus Woesearchaeota archaeon]|nr:PspC domain-containing protein [Candidatus Woesearchaeota archaeon]